MGKKKDQDAPAPRFKCDAEGWCWAMAMAIESTGQGRKGLRVAQMADRTMQNLTLAVVYDFGKLGWSDLRCCPFCEGDPNARYAPAKQADEVTP